jgi:uncharacterized repeat protein (TIGR04042 family)
MPELIFEVRWPDGHTQRCYSPSLVMHDYLRVGAQYSVSDFLDRSATALTEASERVRAKFGFACTSAAESNARIVSAAAQFDPTATVTVVSMHPESA